jgi:hypothetical protein
MNVQTVTDLSLLNPLTNTYNGFIQKYPLLSKQSYILNTEADGKISFSANRKFYHNEKLGKALPAFTASANVAAPSPLTNPITVTLGTGSYYESGTKSPVAVGMVFMNQRTGNKYEVTAVNKATASAHTVTLSPLDTYATGNVVATDPFTYMVSLSGEASTTKDGLYIDREQITNELVTIRTFQKYTDWSKQNVTEIKDSQGNFMGIEKLNDPMEIERFLQQQEVYLMEGAPITNNSNLNNVNKGLMASIDELYSAATAIDDAFFAELRRRSDANGYTNNYDSLTDTEFMIKVTNYIKSNYQNGAIIYVDAKDSGKDMSVAANFRSYSIYGLQLNFMDYAYFNSAQVWGIDPSYNYRKNTALNIPQGLGTDFKTGERIPHFGIRYTTVDGRPEGDMIKVIKTGGLAPVPTDQELSVTVSHTTNKAVQVFAANGYLKIDLNV